MYHRGITKKTYKNLKKEIIEDTALNVGYYPKVINKIDNELLLETFKEISLKGWIKDSTSDSELANMLVTESVKKMSYQEFKDIADNFFSFVPDDKDLYYKASTIEVTRENYDYLINNTRKLFRLEKEADSIDKKIEILETKKVPSKDEVLGIDFDNREILLLKSSENVYINEDVIIPENVLNSYRYSDNAYKQILDSLIESYNDIKLLHHEYVLNNDTYRGLINIDYYDIDEIEPEDIPVADFKNHREYYDFGKEYDSFRDKYSSYEDYIQSTFNTIYSREYLPDYSKEIIENKIKEIDNILEQNDSQLILRKIYGYMQGEEYLVGYLADIDDDIETIEDYIDDYLEPFYRGELTELQIISFDDFEKGEFIGDLENSYYISESLLYNLSSKEKLAKVQETYKDLKSFKDKEIVLKEESKNNSKEIKL